MVRNEVVIGAIVLPLLLAGCLRIGPEPRERRQETATARMIDSSGDTIGTAVLQEFRDADGQALRITMNMTGLPEGEHGIHIHETGRCDPPDFSTAGAHFSPEPAQHGLENENAGPHAGDLPNLVVDETGTARQELVNPRVRLIEGEFALLDDDGAALVIHADPDDQTTDPSGGSGARIACGVIELYRTGS